MKAVVNGAKPHEHKNMALPRVVHGVRDRNDKRGERVTMAVSVTACMGQAHILASRVGPNFQNSVGTDSAILPPWWPM